MKQCTESMNEVIAFLSVARIQEECVMLLFTG